MNPTFLTVSIVGTLAVVSPGPDFIIVSRMSLLYSRRAGIAAALGIATGLVWGIVCSIAGVSYILSQATSAFTAMKWAGAAYLIYLGVNGLRSKGATAAGDGLGTRQCQDIATAKAYRVGVLTNLLNPKCALFFMSLFTMVISPGTSVLDRAICGFEVMAITIVWFSLVATFLTIGRVKRLFKRCSLWLDRVTGAVLVALGLKIVLSKA